MEVSVQPRTELDLFNKPRICELGDLTDILDHISTLNVPELKRLLRDEFYNSALMDATACIIDSISLQAPGNVKYNQRIRNKINSLNLIGKSTYGFAFSASLNNLSDLFVVKVAAVGNLIHEAVVALYGTNLLREEVPNFAYTFGTFDCSIPFLSKQGAPITWCTTTDNNDINGNKKNEIYLVQENITPAVTMFDYNIVNTFEHILNALFQVLYALRTANVAIDFTHYDLHSANVLIRDLGKTIYLPYTTERKITEYIKTSSLATIIDFGSSHMVYEGIQCGYSGMEKYGVSAKRSFPLFDVYKIVMFSLSDYYWYKPNSKLTKAYRIMRYFYPNSTDDELKRILGNRNAGFSLPYSEALVQKDPFEFISYLRSLFATPFILQEQNLDNNIPVYVCNSYSKCQTLPELNVNLGLSINGILRVTSAADFYDLVSRLEIRNESRGSQNTEIASVISSFVYPRMIQVELTIFRSNVRRLNKWLPGADPWKQIMFVGIQVFQNFLNSVLEYADILFQTEFLADALLYVATKYNDDEVISEVDDAIRNVLVQKRLMLGNVLTELRADQYSSIHQANYKLLVKSRPELGWLYREFPEITI